MSDKVDKMDLWVCRVNEISLSLKVDGVTINEIKWEDVNRIEIKSKDLNLSWVFNREGSELVFPVGIENKETVLSVVQSKFKNFDNEKFITSMTSVDDNTFVLWEKN